MRKTIPLLLLLALTVAGCQSALFTLLYITRGNIVQPEHEILLKLKEEKRVAIVPRVMFSNSLELQNGHREIARRVNSIFVEELQNRHSKRVRVVEQAKVEAWLNERNGDFDTFAEVGRDRSINADIVIGIDIIEFQIRDPMNASLMQGRCMVEVRAIEVATGRVVATSTLTIIDPPNAPIPSNPQRYQAFRAQFIEVAAQQIAKLFHPYDPRDFRRNDADNLEMFRVQ